MPSVCKIRPDVVLSQCLYVYVTKEELTLKNQEAFDKNTDLGVFFRTQKLPHWAGTPSKQE